MSSPEQILAAMETFLAPVISAGMVACGALAGGLFILGIAALLGFFDPKGDRK